VKTCPYCKSVLTETRGIFGAGGRFIRRDSGYMIRSYCPGCDRFIGYRGVQLRKVKKRS